MQWLTERRMRNAGGIGSAIFFAGFTICKLAGSEPKVSWAEGVFSALVCGVVVILFLYIAKQKTATIEKMFYRK